MIYGDCIVVIFVLNVWFLSWKTLLDYSQLHMTRSVLIGVRNYTYALYNIVVFILSLEHVAKMLH